MDERTTELKIGQLSGEISDITDRVTGLENEVRSFRDRTETPGRVLARIDGIEREIVVFQAILERLAYLTHRHDEPTPPLGDVNKEVPYYPPGCPEQCWRQCACPRTKTQPRVSARRKPTEPQDPK